MDFTIVYMRPGDTSYLGVLNDLAEDVRHRRCVPLLGAGISRDPPSGLPLADNLVAPLVYALEMAAVAAIRDTKPSNSDLTVASTILGELRLERVLDALHKTYGKSALEYLSALNGDDWNVNHAVIARLAKRDLLPWCITLNFDLLIEKALQHDKVGCETLCPLAPITSFQTGSDALRTKILKPHGSFAPSDISCDPYALLSATLSQAGSMPVPSNVKAIREVIQDCPVLLVAGYSDNDWDILPIFTRLATSLKRIVWVAHTDKCVSSPSWNGLQSEGIKRVVSWLNDCLKLCGVEQVTLVVGPTKELLQDICELVCGENVQVPSGKALARAPDISPFVADGVPIDVDTEAVHRNPLDPARLASYVGTTVPVDIRTIKTAVSLSLLLATTGKFNDHLLHWLDKHPMVKQSPELSCRVAHCLASTAHMRHEYRKAIQLRKKVLRLGTIHEGGSAYYKIELANEYLCQLKRPSLKRLLAAPILLLRGRRLLKQGIAAATADERERLVARATFYQTDVLLWWSSVSVLFGQRAVRLFRPLFRFISHKYDTLPDDWHESEGNYYYWLRPLEARLLAGAPVDYESTMRRLDAIERADVLTQENTQLGNACAYRALLIFLRGKDPLQSRKDRARDQLDKAEEYWASTDSGVATARIRLTLFRRLIGRKSCLEAVSELLRSP